MLHRRPNFTVSHNEHTYLRACDFCSCPKFLERWRNASYGQAACVHDTPQRRCRARFHICAVVKELETRTPTRKNQTRIHGRNSYRENRIMSQDSTPITANIIICNNGKAPVKRILSRSLGSNLVISVALGWMEIEQEYKSSSLKYNHFVLFMLPCDRGLKWEKNCQTIFTYNSYIFLIGCIRLLKFCIHFKMVSKEKDMTSYRNAFM